ncbi:MAG: carbon-nitrogen hydrolase family protein [Gemmatimonadota bacterium]
MGPRKQGKLGVAVVQRVHDPDPQANLQSALGAIAEAARAGAELIAFPETWLPGYPAWLDVCPSMSLWDHGPTKAVYRRFHEHSITVPGPETERIARAASDGDTTVVMGAVERVDGGAGHGTLYNVLLTFGADGTLVNHHRKLMPTFTERLVWGLGDARGVRTVTAGHTRIGGLICWEHWMPLARQALHEAAEQIHVAAWPQVKEMNLIASRHYAFEGRCFVLCAGGLMRADSLPPELTPDPSLVAGPDSWVLRGGSCIIGPDGSFIVEPVYERADILFAELDLGRIAEEAMALDVTGHYSRPDCFRLLRMPTDSDERGATSDE